ncbi:MAG: trimethylamine methyltransferase family protein [Candidatus Bipolaricaulaceae bacterium]
MTDLSAPVQLKVLGESQLEEIHESAVRLLDKVGFELPDPQLRCALGEHGARVEGSRVFLPPAAVSEALTAAPSEFTLWARSEDGPHLQLSPGRAVHLGTGGGAIRILDLEEERVREPSLQDLADLAWLVDNLPHVHFFLRPVIARDVPGELLDVNTLYACLAGTRKHVMVAAGSPGAVDDLWAVARLVVGDEEELLARPIFSLVCSWMVSPLRVDASVAHVLRRALQLGIPVALSSAPVTGSTAPATLAGVLVQVHAEELSGIVLAQALRNGARVLYGPVPAAANFHTMGYLGGAVESGLLNAAATQLAHHIGLPVYSDAGLTEAKTPDIQAGYEKATNLLLVTLAGGDFIHHAAGMMDSMMGVAPEQYVLDNDICGMALRARAGISVEPETTAEEVIARVGPGGHFLAQPHTLRHIRSDEFFTPCTADRSSLAAWEEGGRQGARARAKEVAREILARRRPGYIPPPADKEIRSQFDILLKGAA